MSEILRYAVNGVVATLAHYATLAFNLEVLGLRSAGLANFIAAAIGISVSFIGSRYFVFAGARGSLAAQVVKFGGLYGAIAILHGAVLFAWTDVMALDYRAGFLIATALQVSLSYVGNKRLVFRT